MLKQLFLTATVGVYSQVLRMPGVKCIAYFLKHMLWTLKHDNKFSHHIPMVSLPTRDHVFGTSGVVDGVVVACG